MSKSSSGRKVGEGGGLSGNIRQRIGIGDLLRLNKIQTKSTSRMYGNGRPRSATTVKDKERVEELVSSQEDRPGLKPKRNYFDLGV